MDLDSLLARSRDPGNFVERQTFTLSRDKAREKMSKFSLRYPGQYGLEIVSAGVFAGGRWMFMDTEESSMTVGWVGGRALTKVELDGLFDYLFVAEEIRTSRHLRQIAISVNVLLQMKPKQLRIESGDGDRAVRLDLNANGTGELGVPEHAIDGTYLHVSFGRSWFQSQKKHLAKAVQLVETQCLYSQAPVFLNGDGPFGWAPTRKLEGLYNASQVTFKDNFRDGWIGRVGRRQAPLFKIIVGGVCVSTREIPELGPGLTGVIRDDGLIKTADMSDVVADDRWLTMLHALQPHATSLIRDHNPNYIPPELAPPPEPEPFLRDLPQAEEARPSNSFRRIGSLYTHDEAALRALGECGPVYAVQVDAELRPELDPIRFDHPVILHDPSNLSALSKAVPHLHVLGSDDIEFVAEQVRKAQRYFTVDVVTPAREFTLRLRQNSTEPSPIGVCVQQGGRTRRLLTLPISAPGVSVILEVTPIELHQVGLEHSLTPLILAHLWRLLPGRQEAHFALTRMLMSQIHQHTGPDGIEPRFPSDWPEASTDVILDSPLVESGLTGRAFLGMLGTAEVATLDANALAQLSTLCDRLGHGHFSNPTLASTAVRQVLFDHRWYVAHGEQPNESTRAVLRVGVTFDPQLPEEELADTMGGMVVSRSLPTGWKRIQTPHPVLLAAHRGEEDVPWEEGWALLAGSLAPSEHVHWTNDLLRYATLAIPGPHTKTLQLPSSHGEAVPFEELGTGRIRLALRSGPELAEEDTLLVTVDEAALLRQHFPNLQWRFDDAPEVWESEPGDPSQWLVVTPVSTLEAHGWLGLRHPYDPTGSVLVRTGWRTRVISEIDRQVRCHGFVTWLTDNEALASEQLHQSVAQLLDALAEALESPTLSKAHRRTAERYAADFAWMARSAPTKFSASLSRLAGDVPIQDTDGKAWGTLALWLETHPSIRPDLPFEIHGEGGRPVDTAVARDLPVLQDELLCARVQHAIARLGLDLATTTVLTQTGTIHVGEGAHTLLIRLGTRHPWVHAALQGEVRALRFLLLEVGRKLHALERNLGIEHDFHAIQVSLLLHQP